MLKFDSLYVSHSTPASLVPLLGASSEHVKAPGPPADIASRNVSGSSSRPRTPPSSTSQKPRPADSSTPPPKSSSGARSPPLKTYFSFLSKTNDDWNVDDPEGPDVDEAYEYADDGDEFGLPTLSNVKRKPRRDPSASAAAAQGRAVSAAQPPYATNEPPSTHTRRFSDSGDIAIERPAASYPMPKKSEGKILRPQYKDILKGTQPVALPQAPIARGASSRPKDFFYLT